MARGQKTGKPPDEYLASTLPRTDKREVEYKAEVRERRWLSADTFEITLTRPAGFDFAAGQTLRAIHGPGARPYSLINAVGSEQLAICVRCVPDGGFSRLLASASPGDAFRFTGPHGHFVFRPSLRPAVFAATGTGIAPFVSMARSGISGFTLLHGVRTSKELYYHELFRSLPADYHPCLSREPAEDARLPDAFLGRLTQFIRNRLPPRPYDFYLCGRQEMIRDAILLVDDHFPGSHVYTEVFF
jgi:benzoate/toluate 1,2-dioxygenase reductase component